MTNNDIIDAISRELAAADPKAVIYPQFCPKEMERPSHFIELGNVVQTDLSRLVVGITMDITITSFLPVDARGESSWPDMLAAQDLVANIFRRGCLPVGDRALTVRASAGGDNGDRVYTDVHIEYADDRPTPGGSVTEKIEHVHLRLEDDDGITTN